MWPDSEGLNCRVLTRCPRVTVHSDSILNIRTPHLCTFVIVSSSIRLNVAMMVDIKLDTLLLLR